MWPKREYVLVIAPCQEDEPGNKSRRIGKGHTPNETTIFDICARTEAFNGKRVEVRGAVVEPLTAAFRVYSLQAP
jgi:hypothetical protein